MMFLSAYRVPSPVRAMLLATAIVVSGLPGLIGMAYGDEAVLLSSEFDPSPFLVGEMVTMYARLDPGKASWSEATLVDGLGDSGGKGPHILSVALENRSGSPLLIVRFVPWSAGPSYLPPLSISGLRIPKIRFDCDSALAPGDKGPPLMMTQMEYPGMYSRLYIVGGLLLGAALLGLMLATKARPWILHIKARLALARSRRTFDETIKRLGEGGLGPAAWAELCSAVRQFTGLRSGSDWSALTTADVEALPDDAAKGGVRPDVARLFAMGDAVRFAGDKSQSLEVALVLAASIADRLDEAHRLDQAHRLDEAGRRNSKSGPIESGDREQRAS